MSAHEVFPLLLRTITVTQYPMAQENLLFLSVEQIESVRFLASSRPRSLTSLPTGRLLGRMKFHSFTGTGSSIPIRGRWPDVDCMHVHVHHTTAISLFEHSWLQMKQTRS